MTKQVYKIATWNVWYKFGDYKARQELIARELQALDCDIILLEEVFEDADCSQAQVLAEKLGMHYCYKGARNKDGAMFGNAILSKFPIASHQSHVLPRKENSHERYVVEAFLETPNGHFPVYVTHLSWQPADSGLRQEQVEFIMTLIQQNECPIPAILGGDFNADADSMEVMKLTGKAAADVDGLCFFDLWTVINPEAPGYTLSKDNKVDHQPLKRCRRVDYLFLEVTQNKLDIQVEKMFIFGDNPTNGQWASDHYGICAHLSWTD
ncbi:MAG: hypothetical protein S4CHLAM102_00280 [Chlamydiia bacterium]|nr:hypothetical protein [Chlamydiia bacterium]